MLPQIAPPELDELADADEADVDVDADAEADADEDALDVDVLCEVLVAEPDTA